MSVFSWVDIEAAVDEVDVPRIRDAIYKEMDNVRLTGNASTRHHDTSVIEEIDNWEIYDDLVRHQKPARTFYIYDGEGIMTVFVRTPSCVLEVCLDDEDKSFVISIYPLPSVAKVSGRDVTDFLGQLGLSLTVLNHRDGILDIPGVNLSLEAGFASCMKNDDFSIAEYTGYLDESNAAIWVDVRVILSKMNIDDRLEMMGRLIADMDLSVIEENVMSGVLQCHFDFLVFNGLPLQTRQAIEDRIRKVHVQCVKIETMLSGLVSDLCARKFRG